MPQDIDQQALHPWLAEQLRAHGIVNLTFGDVPAEAATDLRTMERFRFNSVMVVRFVVGESDEYFIGGMSMRRERKLPDELALRLRLLAEIFVGTLSRCRAEEERTITLQVLRRASTARTLDELLRGTTQKNTRLGKAIDDVPQRVMNTLIEYDWPGNIRELENVVERAMILSPGRTLVLSEVLEVPVRAGRPHRFSSRLEEVDRAHIVGVLEQCRWTIKGPGHAAERLGLAPSTLRYRMRKLGIHRPVRSTY
ncbi:MAG: helix-turn-helix domain-containing protein [Rhodothermia bacterium]